ncbi:phosphatidylinositol mannoside acyltransferase [Cryptosporangium aurantiacum]|uniref:KDO2-lipid IV(A) lauroyltransferase n=1 Tax=Cryptosporangium aurantiacum TaxID=134849 RepID=A0A1M7RFL3_9ACTN|nr:phosphatidylinositol mannoside acyltransferase [Cryptosporangium aurantiacum]SHN45065.1 KDO2-lipid IV(A) lauroyltransferase [Cryptosporangium aurantiacum]
MNERVTGAAYAAGWKLVRVLPERPVRALFEGGAGWMAGRGGASVRRLAANLRRVVGPEMSDADLADLTKRGLQSYARYWYEAFRMPEWSHAEIERRFVLENVEELDRAVAAGRGVVVALPHAGNWDLAGAWATLHGVPVTTVAERLKPEDLYQRFLSFRRALGMEILPLTGASRPPLDVLTERVRAGRVAVLLSERDLSARGIEVDFFGERTKMPAGPAVLALRTGAPLFGLALWNDGPVTRARLIGPIETGPGSAVVRGEAVTPGLPAPQAAAQADAEQPAAAGAVATVAADEQPDATPTKVHANGGTSDGGDRSGGDAPHSVKIEDGHRDAARVAAVTQRVADALAEGIAEHPVDWHMLQPLWLADLPPRRRRRTAD